MRFERAILLADVSGSTRLYRQFGDEKASQMVFECVAGMQRIATENGGEFVRSKGDDVLCLFGSADDAMAAARGILNLGAHGMVPVHAGLHWGMVVSRGEELFGDAINVAARLGGQAKENEVLISRVLVDQSAQARAGLRAIGEVTLRGINMPTEIFALLAEAGEDGDATSMMTQRTLFDTQQKQIVSQTSLRLTWQGHVRDVPEGATIKIGRAAQCDLIVPEAWISRVHASVSVRGGLVELVDSSSAGCAVSINDAPSFYLRRQSVALTGRGVIELGGGTAESPQRIAFEVLQSH